MGCARSCPRRSARKESVASSLSARGSTRLVSASGCWSFRRSSKPPGASGRSSTSATPSPSTLTATRCSWRCSASIRSRPTRFLHGYVKLAPGAWVAQTGASSATARYVLALAKHAGLRTLNVVRRAESVKSLLDAGADVVLVEGDDLAEQAADAIGDAPLELIIDAVAGEPVAQLAPLLKTGGHDRQLHRPRPAADEHLDPRSHLPRAERSRLLAEPLAGEHAARDRRRDLPRARRPGRRRHPRTPRSRRPTGSPITAKRSPTPPATTATARCSSHSDRRPQ